MDISNEFPELEIEKRAFINGSYVDAEDGAILKKKNSYDGKDISGIADCSESDVDKAVHAALQAFQNGSWSKKNISERCRIVFRWADLLEGHRRELALLDTLETCRAFRNYLNDSIPKAIEAMRYYAGAADKLYDRAVNPDENAFSAIIREPLGVTGIITPWNDPMVVAVWKLVPALLMGNSVVLKPAEQSSLSIIRAAGLGQEAGIPEGVFNVVPGRGETAGRALALHKDVRGIYFTGSSERGRNILRYSGESNMKRVGLECGGKSPFIVTEKCRDIQKAANSLAENVFYNQGQICSAPSRTIVHEEIYEEFVQYVKEESEKFVPGNPYDDDNTVGCVVNRAQFDRVSRYLAGIESGEVWQAETIKDKDPKALCIQPAVITGVESDCPAAREEIFGPVVVILKCRNIEEAVRMANDTDYGLAGGIFTDDMQEAYYAVKNIQAGLVHVNSWGEDSVHTPFGGYKESGLGKDRSLYAFDEYSNLKTIWVNMER